ncbi:m7GpppX diphosphatase-like isoform X1 [Amphibalanus amphitrite]|uniref:m7GpppX diphosphatase-like isoform X1 n=1 Tax=Amphibalanus amphitrite TaxID=1232801 RepID=UPI001C907B48|nr:m7GpppX diphosphatase-like isoform X1 [Amphibalanus amphitrite]XP_043217675.1 m7GpppX diphosphatase-like isoform X1 [Amphibalanus amphitrite]XP_043217676.1 m7GpppX diphosphatase-like isoform X1 [Amphibalanus amphitrite]XP_043217677.1 m7GpppX diphosphatase-like isoform X1 [Amphibalanus amphitrite]XP_043217678.1 m7GpppX diphosphatase-like isoform X1 [Amphibalanus amphitrite]XP_043217679.1 m7GpppX diphosphatase-like isoform X1 [Amphibalanus amphitrite]XP_043217680.1 m7GpppX diphosphatase-like
MSSDADHHEPEAKRAKTEDSNNAGDTDIHLDLKDFAKFKFGEVLKEDPVRKTLALKATVDGSTDPAVVFLEKSAFTEECGKKILESDTTLKQTFHNDIYGSYTGFPQQELNGVKVTIIHPATSKHIAKFSAKESIIVNETPQLYKDVLLEHLKESAFNVQWVYNILEHRSEQERIVCEDADPETGFVLVPDLKWDGESLESLYLQALVHRRGLRSIRDLTADHLPLLRNIRDRGCEAIEKKYGVPASELRVYFHYQPSYYHLHVHFTSVQFDAPGTHVGKAHFLSTVINNLELVPDYYQRATLTYYLPRSDPLADKLRRATDGVSAE